jgi:hypothetical protein
VKTTTARCPAAARVEAREGRGKRREIGDNLESL